MHPQKYLEVESKYSIDSHSEVPDLTQILNVAQEKPPERFDLSAIYFDTEDLRLTRAKMTLRHRDGGHDAGWHLKLPDAGHGRLELGMPATGSSATADHVPAELIREVRATVRDQPLRPIAQVDNHREERRLVDDGGATVAHFCDDRVTAQSLLPGGSRHTWREWEFELDPAIGSGLAHQILESADEVLALAGAVDSPSPSKLLTALGDTFDAAPAPEGPLAFRKHDENDEAFAGVLHALAAARDRLISCDPGTRRADPDSVRGMTTALRDLRSVLRMFVELFDHERRDTRVDIAVSLETEFSLLHDVVRKAEHAQAIARRITELIADEAVHSPGLVDAAAQNRLIKGVEALAARATARVDKALDSRAYITVLDDFDELLANPPIPGRMERRKATAIIVRAVKRARVNFRNQRHALFEIAGDPARGQAEYKERFGALQATAERLRAAAQMALDFTPYDAGRLARAANSAVDTLARAEKSAAGCEFIARKSRVAERHGERTFAYGLLFQVERAHNRDVLQKIDRRHRQIRSGYRKFKASIG